ncbi:MAG TPA: VOC family protein, partial [Candidatus Binataceae bacterium]|nr:VOC family protein [Candidatus Binataceae bacterium]
IKPELKSSIEAMRPAVPAKDYAESRRFYAALGFDATPLGPTLTEMRMGGHTFLLQDFYVPELANNFVMHMTVASADEWWAHIESLALEKSFRIRAPIAPRLEPWGRRVTYLFDPSGVLWNINSRP